MNSEMAALKAQVGALRGEVSRLERLLGAGTQPVYADLAVVGRMFGFGQDTLRAWCNQGKLPARKVMGKWLISIKEMHTWIEKEKDDRRRA